MKARFVSALPLISASQISLFRECQRKWAWRYLAKIETPPHPSALLGIDVDDNQLQPYLRDGRPFDYTRDSGYIAASGLEFLPKPQTPGLEVQKHFVLPSPASGGAFGYQGYMDLWLPDSAPVPDMPGGAPFVGDFKTTSDLKWMKSAKTLSSDVQAMLYATDALYETKANAVDLSWMYFQTRGTRKAKRTYLRVGTEHVEQQFRDIESTALEMFRARNAGVAPLDLPPSPAQCEAYGGCPYRDKCNLSPVDHLAALAARDSALVGIQSESNMTTTSLLANLKAKKAGAQQPTPPDGPAAGSAGSETTSVPKPVSTVAPSPPPSLEEHIKENPRAAWLQEQKAIDKAATALGINPPEKDLPEPLAPPPAKRGRPKKDPVAADMAAAVSEKQLPISFPPSPPKEGIDYGKLADAVVDALVVRLAKLSGDK